MIARADDNTANEIPGIRGTCGDEMDDAAGRYRDGDADLYLTQDADANTVGLGAAAAGEAFDGCVYTAYGQAPILDPDKAAQPASRPSGTRRSGRDRLPFTGYQFDDAAGPYLVRNRIYQAELGRWLQRDPAGFVDGSNTYLYVRANRSLNPMLGQ